MAIKVAGYVPNIAILCVMTVGILAMVFFIIKRGALSTDEYEHQINNRHENHRKISLYSLSVFFVGGLMFHLDYIIVEFSCTSKWTDCETEILLINIFEVIFRVGCTIFIICETIVCWVMKNVNFKPSSWIWHGLAVIQAANIAQWFDALLKETDHHLNNNHANVFHEYFIFCSNTTRDHQNRVANDECSKSSPVAYWYKLSMLILFPITIELFLLVSENFLDRCIGTESHSLNQTAGQRNGNQDNGAVVSEQTPLLNENRSTQNSPPLPNSIGLKMFIVVTVVINVVYLVLSVLVFIKHDIKNIDTPGNTDNGLTVYANIYYLFLIMCSVFGILRCRTFQHQPLRTTFLEYLLLFATSGVMLQSAKSVVTFASGSGGHATGWVPVYYLAEFLGEIQASLQTVLYFYAKDVIVDNSHGQRVFKTIMVVLSISNITNWIIDSFMYHNLSITPFSHSVQRWNVFDNAINPITIFFRFNSAMLFWCIGREQRLESEEVNQPEPVGARTRSGLVGWVAGALAGLPVNEVGRQVISQLGA